METLASEEKKSDHFIVPPGVKGRFAVVRLWPGIQAAETEVTARLKRSAAILGLECIEIDPCGYEVETGKKVTKEDVDFAIHLHFETPKNYDLFSFVALWNPLQFYFDFGYEGTSANIASHDDFLSCLSVAADDHVKRLIYNDPLHKKPKFHMFHSVPGPVVEPAARKRDLFYIGINWEKLGQGKPRHSRLLKELDKTDYFKIYGPQVFQGVRVWKGYKSYVGEIPFDGKSVVDAIAKVGAGLIFSSKAHFDSELMSNRLFETIAAGALVICDEHPFAKKHFGDCLLYVDSSAKDVFIQVDRHMDWANANPEKALEIIRKSQEILKDKFMLTKSLKTLYEGLDDRKRELNSFPEKFSKSKVFLLCVLTDENPESETSLISSCISQTHKNVHVVLTIDDSQDLSQDALKRLEQASVSYEVIRLKGLFNRTKENLGSILFKSLESVKDRDFDFFIFFLSHEEIFHDHICSQLSLFAHNSTAKVGAMATVLERKLASKSIYRAQFSVAVDHNQYSFPLGFARFMFRKECINEKVLFSLPYLDKGCISVFLFENEIVFSKRSTSRIQWDSPIYKTRMAEGREELILKDVFPEINITKQVPFYNNGGLLGDFFDSIAPLIKRLPLPIFFRRACRKCYKKVKGWS